MMNTHEHSSSFILKKTIMKKDKTLQLMLGGAIVAGGVYFLFFTERGQRLREKLMRTATDKVDQWLEELEFGLGEAQMAATGDEEDDYDA